jgi:hypothetical protein
MMMMMMMMVPGQGFIAAADVTNVFSYDVYHFVKNEFCQFSLYPYFHIDNMMR